MEVVSTWARIFGKIIEFEKSEDGESSLIQGGQKYKKEKDHGNGSDIKEIYLNGKFN